MRIEIRECAELPRDKMASLVTASVEEGHEFVVRLLREWESGDNRFDQPGEAVYLAHQGDDVVGVCGLNCDPFAGSPTIGRLRRLYVTPAFRGSGIARRLVDVAVEHGRDYFHLIRVRAGTQDAVGFYDRIGFERRGEAHVTHALDLRRQFRRKT